MKARLILLSLLCAGNLFAQQLGYSLSSATSGLVIGTDIQAYDADLTTYGGITPSANMQTFLGAATYAAMRTQLALTIGTNVEAFDADLDTWAGVTPGTGVATALALNIGSAGAPILFNGAGGTPSSMAGTNFTGTGASFTAGNATKWTTSRTVALTGDVTYTSGSLDGSGNVTGTATLANVPIAATHATSNTTIPTNTGGWTEYFVTTSDVTTTGQALVDITGLVTGTLSNSVLYEIEATLLITTSADATGTQYGIHGAGTGTAATTNCVFIATTTQNSTTALTVRQVDVATATFMTTASSSGTVYLRGWFTSTSTGTATLSLQHLKVTSGTSTVKVGSVLRIRKAHT